MGIKIPIGEHFFELPEQPAKTDILFWNKPKKDQYWVRQTDFPKFFLEWTRNTELDADYTRYDDAGNLISISRKDTGDEDDFEKGNEGTFFYYKEREEHRRVHGIWFMNNGTPTYITGNHYACLQWFAMRDCTNDIEPGSNYGQYYEFQRDVAYWWEICKTTTFGRGGVMVKPKKTGLTQLVSLFCLNEICFVRDKIIRMMSITQKISAKVNFALISYAVEKACEVILPAKGNENVNEILFGNPDKMSRAIKKKKDPTRYLNSSITTVATDAHGFDGLTNLFAICDEFPKIEDNTCPADLFPNMIAAVMEGVRRKGTVFCMSYVPENNSESVNQSRVICKESKLSTVSREGGQTKSKLIYYVLLSQQGLFGCCDKYGKPNLHEVNGFIDGLIEDCKGDAVKIQGVQRAYPRSEYEIWSEANDLGALFDNHRLDAKLQKLESESLSSIEFDFEWEVEPDIDPLAQKYDFKNARVRKHIITLAEKKEGRVGKFTWYRPELTPLKWLHPHLNSHAINSKTGRMKPSENNPFVASFDPVDYRLAKEIIAGSQDSAGVFILPNPELDSMVGEKVSNKRMLVEYHYRNDKPDDTIWDMIMMVLYFGCYFLPESNKPTLATQMIIMGLGEYLLAINDKGAIEPYRYYSETQNLFSTQRSNQINDVSEYVTAGKQHLSEPDTKLDIDNIDYLDSVNVIRQLMQFNSKDTKKYDAAMKYLIGIIACNALMGHRQKEKTNQNKKADRVSMQAVCTILH